MKRIIPSLIIAVIFIFIFKSEFNKLNTDTKEKPRLRFSFVGDLMCHSPQYEYAKCGKDTFDFRPAYAEVKKVFSESDYVIGNLETVVLGKGSQLGSYPLFNSPFEFLEALKYAGFNILITSNNHSLDRGTKGIEKTIFNLNKIGINHLGTYKSQEERDSIKIYSMKGIKLAFLSYTYGVNGNYIPKEKSYLVNLIDTVLIKKDILSARSNNADVVLVYFHFGEEYQNKPNQYQKEIVKKTFEHGADLIIASHPHAIQPLEFLTTKKSKIDQSFVSYSLGNFISNQRWRYSDCGVILNFTIEKTKEEKIVLDSVWITPTWVFKGKVGGKNQFVILPSDTSQIKNLPGYVGKLDKEKMQQSFLDTKRTMKTVDSFRKKTSLGPN